MKTSKKLKGFTLVELIIVIAVFSVIMFGALQLIDPISRVFTNSYNQESVSASTDNIKRYLEGNMRYAEYVRISDTAPTHDDLVQFVDDYYNGMVYQTDTLGATEYAHGDLYVIKIDNANGGKISQWELKYQAGDRCAVGTDPDPTDLDPTLYLYYNDHMDNLAADTDDIPSTVTPAFNAANPDTEWAINKAMYNNYNFNVSLGVYELVNGVLTRDDDYYNAYSNADQQIFGQRNFALTITAYGRNDAKGTIDRQVDPSTGLITYHPGYVYSSSLAFNNVKAARTYNRFSWQYDTTKGTYKETVLDKDDNDVIKYVTDQPVTANPFVVNVSDMIHPNEIYIIYSFGGSDIIR